MAEPAAGLPVRGLPLGVPIAMPPPTQARRRRRRETVERAHTGVIIRPSRSRFPPPMRVETRHCADHDVPLRLPRCANAAAQVQYEPVVRELGSHSAFPPERRNPCGDRARVALDDLRAAVREHRSTHARTRTPPQLDTDRCVADRPAVPAPDDGSDDRGAVAHIQVEARERLALVIDGDQVRCVEERRASCLDAVADRGRAERVLDRERLKTDPAEVEPLTRAASRRASIG